MPDVVILDKVPTWVTWDKVASTFKVFVDLVNPVPPNISPAEVNFANTRECVPTVSLEESFVHNHPVSFWSLPSWTNTKNPPTSSFNAKSVALVGAPDALTV